ncbi:bacteriodes thetaiotaomicron symbiotic chitinase, putative [Talaromyces stipitatus ATCC 10500]|uniref:chitinase n=1 Tax=Talaromyces stipitatus (strain ATCC 10500 / CBS 375.48 / QM 6759 / NRRL 1006) TaxID=441959 RepID=B8MCG8_TALSN|nr:bacteriodes thetaiotaomicron symbiotic chitinase, putative [Talaromyces stipitatus ATCC 10500]EED18783.1 bacteriodes thetaiotaomicron symbiotic chitinase, putative [Talaromyces stipitatus ATCC 10500]
MAMPIRSRRWLVPPLFILILFVISNLELSSFSKSLLTWDQTGQTDKKTTVTDHGDFLQSPQAEELGFGMRVYERDSSNSTMGQGSYTCGPGSPCSNGACCGSSGWCGYGSTYCGDGCQSNCNATAECGKDASPAGKTCPLNVCCSQFGFCGTTSDFCVTGCQSNCPQPVPDAPASNTQTRIVGYWEAWNSENPCGTMPPGQIPATLLTHLNVAFAYISDDFDLTTMPGVPEGIYQSVGNVKFKNPELKLIITVGGWDFSQQLFSQMVSSATSRATFIQNVLSWLGEYGYDGIDFDWEYPGASDRDGQPEDGANFATFLQELRAAINTAGKDYILTFTAPTSYWYLQNFDLANMIPYVDWVNLMSYDLHGVWDSTDRYIGSEVFAHTNLTEIDLALDLFWRVNVDPSDIVLGLGFYGRTYELADTSCWKPGCSFLSAGAAGPCTHTPGILSYREIKQIIADTGATPYVDTSAAVNYMVYSGNNWVSYDDEQTFAAKIEYANKMGLGGLMVWAIDLDDSNLEALKAITDKSVLNASSVDFSLVPLEYLFPSQYLPLDNSTIQWGITTFGAAAAQGSMDPAQTGFGLMLIAGDSYAVTTLNKRSETDPEPFTFLNCPENVMDASQNEAQTVRVVCLSDDVEGCFRITERGVKGTIVEMPENCARQRFARAISLEVSEDQHISLDQLGKRSASSQVYDFSFDFDLSLARRDTDNTIMRIDVSNMPGYWDGMVNYPGIQDSDLSKIKARFFAPNTWEWDTRQSQWLTNDTSAKSDISINQDVSAPIFWQATGIGECPVNGSDFTEGIVAYVDGTVNASLSYGFSMIAELTVSENENTIQPVQMSGFVSATGQTDLTHGVAGVGNLDISQANIANPATVTGSLNNLDGSVTVDLSQGRTLIIQPYIQFDYQLATYNSSGSSPDGGDSTVHYDGELKVRSITDLGEFKANFPQNSSSSSNGSGDFPYNDKRKPNQISISKNNILYSAPSSNAAIGITTFVTFGVKADLQWFGPSQTAQLTEELADMELKWSTQTIYTFGAPDSVSACVDYNVSTTAWQTSDQNSLISSDAPTYLVSDVQSPDAEELCYATYVKNGTLSGSYPGWGYQSDSEISPSTFIGSDSDIFTSQKSKIKCNSCVSCMTETEEDEEPTFCCGCVCMDCIYGNSDLTPCPDCDPVDVDGSWPTGTFFQKRQPEIGELSAHQTKENATDLAILVPRVVYDVTLTEKEVNSCFKKISRASQQFMYPSFPNNVHTQWETLDNGAWNAVARYYGNTSSSCVDWSVGPMQPADQVYIAPGRQVRAKYQTEHVFEGQLIGDFFDQWLEKGRVKNQPARVMLSSASIVDCNWSKEYAMSITRLSWTLPQVRPYSIANVMWSELGNVAHLDRLTIFLSRPNQIKGSLFSMNQAISPTGGYARKAPEAQLMSVKEFGMVFEYMNNPNVWAMFCDTFEAIYGDLVVFDRTYQQQYPNNPINTALATEWSNYIRATLDTMVVNSRTLFDALYAARNGAGSPLSIYEFLWFQNLPNRALIQLPGTCTHLAGTSV